MATRLVAAGVAALVLFGSLAHSGIWDPYELDAADLARRIAIQVFGARGLDLPHAATSLPTLSDLKMGELPFTSMAVGFRLFGLHDWVGRLPLAVWAFVGAAVMYAFFERLVHRRVGLYAVVALVTMPLVFMQARTMLGDAVTMAAFSMAFFGLAGAAFDDVGGAPARATWAAVGALGLASGYLSRGAILGVAAPALGVGAAWLVTRRGRSVARDLAGGAALVVGLAALAIGARLFFTASSDAPLSRVLGFAILKKQPLEATFDLTIRQLGHALFPWSAFVPLAVGRLVRPPPVTADVASLGAGDPAAARAREAEVRVALLVGSAVAYAAFAFVATRAGNLAFSAPALLAGVAAIAVFDLERGAPSSRSIGVATALLAIVLLADLLHEPDRALACFVVDKPTSPKSFEAEGAALLKIATLAFVGLVALAWFEEQPGARTPKEHASISARARRVAVAYGEGLDELNTIWQGNLAFTLVVVEAALVGLAAMVFVGRYAKWAPVLRLPKTFADVGVVAWAVAPALLAAAPLVVLGARDGFRALVDVTRTRRGAWVFLGALASGGVMSFGYYAELAAQLSPKEVFEAYARLEGHRGEPLALLNVRARAASYYSGGDVEAIADPVRAWEWLKAGGRRWLVLRAEDLPKVNSLSRQDTKKNLPVLDARSSQILLASNELGGEKNQTTLATIALDEPPAPTHVVHATFEDQLETIGWDVIEDGKKVESVVPGTKYKLRVYYHVLRPISATWKAFVHVDGYQRRYNGDHVVCDGRYPMVLWQPGDDIADELEFQLEPNFTPGDYNVYFGFFLGESRWRITEGPEQDNRVDGGSIHVR
ncbi:MAG TPA: glycosyltransferase family 39 protein [Byssovorax sp.]